jgi:hypothetical protein
MAVFSTMTTLVKRKEEKKEKKEGNKKEKGVAFYTYSSSSCLNLKG